MFLPLLQFSLTCQELHLPFLGNLLSSAPPFLISDWNQGTRFVRTMTQLREGAPSCWSFHPLTVGKLPPPPTFLRCTLHSWLQDPILDSCVSCSGKNNTQRLGNTYSMPDNILRILLYTYYLIWPTLSHKPKSWVLWLSQFTNEIRELSQTRSLWGGVSIQFQAVWLHVRWPLLHVDSKLESPGSPQPAFSFSSRLYFLSSLWTRLLNPKALRIKSNSPCFTQLSKIQPWLTYRLSLFSDPSRLARHTPRVLQGLLLEGSLSCFCGLCTKAPRFSASACLTLSYCSCWSLEPTSSGEPWIPGHSS